MDPSLKAKIIGAVVGAAIGYAYTAWANSCGGGG
jgi:hypothetical protein